VIRPFSHYLVGWESCDTSIFERFCSQQFLIENGSMVFALGDSFVHSKSY